VEDRRRWERERVLKEKKEAEERDRKMNEKLQMIEEQRFAVHLIKKHFCLKDNSFLQLYLPVVVFFSQEDPGSA